MSRGLASVSSLGKAAGLLCAPPSVARPAPNTTKGLPPAQGPPNSSGGRVGSNSGKLPGDRNSSQLSSAPPPEPPCLFPGRFCGLRVTLDLGRAPRQQPWPWSVWPEGSTSPSLVCPPLGESSTLQKAGELSL